MASALEAFGEALLALRRGAVLVAREALEKVLGDVGASPDLVARIVKAQVDGLEREAALAVEVSAQDFPDAEARQALRERLGGGRLEIRALPSLRAGDCRIQLSLWSLEVGAPLQWSRLSALLAELAKGADA